MTTQELISAALAARDEFESASLALEAATARLQTAKDNLTAANLQLHDDLAANGPACVVDTSTQPATVTMYSASDPDTWIATPIRVAA